MNAKKMGISLSYFITHKDDESITETEMDNFCDEFIDLVEKYNWICGGGMDLIRMTTQLAPVPLHLSMEMTSDWARIPWDVLKVISTRIGNNR